MFCFVCFCFALLGGLVVFQLLFLEGFCCCLFLFCPTELSTELRDMWEAYMYTVHRYLRLP